MKVEIGANAIFNGILRRKHNNFFLDIETEKLDYMIDYAHTYFEDLGIMTCVNNIRKEDDDIVKSSGNILKYECGYVVTGRINPSEVLVQEIQMHFKEFDEFFVNSRYKDKIIYPNQKCNKWLMQQKLIHKKLYENEILSIYYYNVPKYSKDKYGEGIYINSVWVRINFKEPIQLSQLDENIRKIENCFGYLLKRKMNLIDLNIIDQDNELHSVIKKNMKFYDEIKWEDLLVVDISSLEILKRIIHQYYENKIFASCINTFYEYIYNDLDIIFEFTSIINSLEMLCTNEKYKKKIITYSQKNNSNLIANNKKMKKLEKKIKSVIDDEDLSFLKSLYNEKYTSLRDKLEYIFFEIFELEKNDKSQKYISKIINTRNYFVHGKNEDKILEGVELYVSKEFVNNILYILLMKNCTTRSNRYTKIAMETINYLYDFVLKNIKL